MIDEKRLSNEQMEQVAKVEGLTIRLDDFEVNGGLFDALGITPAVSLVAYAEVTSVRCENPVSVTVSKLFEHTVYAIQSDRGSVEMHLDEHSRIVLLDARNVGVALYDKELILDSRANPIEDEDGIESSVEDQALKLSPGRDQ